MNLTMEHCMLQELGIPPTAQSIASEIAFLYPTDKEKEEFAKRVYGLNFFDVRKELRREREGRIFAYNMDRPTFLALMQKSPREALTALFQEPICDLKLKRALTIDPDKLYQLHVERPFEWLLNACRLLT
ncbi:hypothetical protein [Paenibacillus sp. GCM10027626]|uniref:hypothetical protein n=1 Tax=Paenibacillus sp. GCM10027626 TaxID=3273411 RepID=UPI003643D81E